MNFDNIFSIKFIGKYRIQIKILGIKISFNVGNMNIYGENNTVEIDKNIKHKVIIDGNNNRVIIKSSPPPNKFWVKNQLPEI